MTGPGPSTPDRVGDAPWINSRGSAAVGSPSGAASAMPRLLSVRPWDDAPIPTAQNFYAQELANLILPGPAGSTVTATPGQGGFQCPKQNILSIQALTLFCDSPALTTSIVYTIRANKAALPGLTNLKFPPQSATFINWPLPGPFNVLVTGAYIDYVITRIVTDVANQVNLTYLGWFNTPQDAQRWTGAYPGQIP